MPVEGVVMMMMMIYQKIHIMVSISRLVYVGSGTLSSLTLPGPVDDDTRQRRRQHPLPPCLLETSSLLIVVMGYYNLSLVTVAALYFNGRGRCLCS
jgi:hypothetical protein